MTELWMWKERNDEINIGKMYYLTMKTKRENDWKVVENCFEYLQIKGRNKSKSKSLLIRLCMCHSIWYELQKYKVNLIVYVSRYASQSRHDAPIRFFFIIIHHFISWQNVSKLYIDDFLFRLRHYYAEHVHKNTHTHRHKQRHKTIMHTYINTYWYSYTFIRNTTKLKQKRKCTLTVTHSKDIINNKSNKRRKKIKKKPAKCNIFIRK